MIDPSNPDVLLAGSNSFPEPTTRVYSSRDGGRTWSSEPGPPLLPGFRGGAGDPGVAIDRNGRQYFSFLARTEPDVDFSGVRLVVASRAGPSRRWETAPVSSGPSGRRRRR